MPPTVPEVIQTQRHAVLGDRGAQHRDGVGGSLSRLQSGGRVGHDQIHTGRNKAVGDGSAGCGVALCILEVEGNVVAKGSRQGILKALGGSIQSGVLHQLADANGELLAVSRCRNRSCCGGSHGRSSCGGSGRTATGRQSGGGTAGSGGSQERTTSDLTHFDFSPLYIAVRAATGCRTRTAEL